MTNEDIPDIAAEQAAANPYVAGQSFTVSGNIANTLSGTSNGATSTTITTYPSTWGMGSIGVGGLQWTPGVINPGAGASSIDFTIAPATLITFETDVGRIALHRDGTIEYPDGLDPAAKAFWDKVMEMAGSLFLHEVRREAAKAVRAHLPRLLPDVDAYARETIPMAIAAAIENEAS